MIKKIEYYFFKILKSTFNIFSIIAVIIVWMAVSYFVVKTGKDLINSGDETITTTDASTNAKKDNFNSSHEYCNVIGINLHGDVVTYHSPESYDSDGNKLVDETSADDIYWMVKDAENDDNIKYIVVEIASPGGSPVAGLEMMRTFKNSTKPVVAFTRNGALSAAYEAATGAQVIFASSASDIGGIGVSASYLESTDKNIKEGLKYVDLSVGKFKDMMNPNRPLNDEEKELILRDGKILYEDFVKTVAENRKLDIGKVRLLADGSSLLGKAALKAGLIDRIGDLYDVEDFLKEKMGEEANICWKN